VNESNEGNSIINEKEFYFSTLRSDSYLMLSRKLIKVLGLEAATFLTVLIDKDFYHTNKGTLTEDGFFYETIEFMEDTTTLSRYAQNQCMEVLKEKGCILSEVRGVPPKRHFIILYESVNNILKSICGTFSNREKSTTYPVEQEKDSGSICGTFTNQFADRSQQLRTDILRTESSIKTIETIVPTPAPAVVVKKVIKLRDTSIPLIDKPAVITEERKPIYRKLHPVVKLHHVATSEIKEVFDYWESKGLPVHRKDTASYSLAIEHLEKLFDGTLFFDMADKSWRNRKFTVREVKQAIDNFVLAAYNDDYEPANHRTKTWLRTIRLKDFFYNPYIAEDKFKSQFLHSLATPKLTKDSILHPIPDKFPFVTKMIAEWFRKEFGSEYNGNISPRKMNDIVAIGGRLSNFLIQNNGNLLIDDEAMRMYGHTNPLVFLALQLTRCADKMLREGEELRTSFTPSWLSSEKMLGDRFPKFLRAERMMR
jgi:hypothetical protein